MTEYRVTSVSLTMTLADSTTLNIGDSDIILGSLSVSEASSGSTEFSIGTAISKRLSFQLKNFNDEYSAYDFNDAQIVATITADADSTVDEANGIVSGFGGTMGSDSVVTLAGASMDDNGIVTLSGSTSTDNYTLGVFYVVEKPNYNGGTITFNALDGLYKTDRDYTTALTFPATLLQIYNELCTNCGIVPAQATIPNANYSVPVKPNLDATTAADMLCYIAQVSGTFAQMNSQGKLELKRYGGTSHALSETFSMEVDTDDVVITGVKVTECFDETDTLKRQTVLNGTAAYALTISENPLVGSGKAQAVADFLTSVYVGMQFRPLRITVPTNPEVHVGDSIVFTDYKGNTYSTYATDVDFSTNAPTTIAMNAASPERNSAVRYSAEAKALAESKRLVENEKTARELAIEQIAQQIAGAGGMYETTVAQTGGGNIYYLHNKPTLAESTTIMRIDDTGIYISNDGGQTYPIGLDYSGTEILDKIYAIGIDADYITTGLIQSRVSGFSLNMDTGVATLSKVAIHVEGNTLESYPIEVWNTKYNSAANTETDSYSRVTPGAYRTYSEAYSMDGGARSAYPTSKYYGYFGGYETDLLWSSGDGASSTKDKWRLRIFPHRIDIEDFEHYTAMQGTTVVSIQNSSGAGNIWLHCGPSGTLGTLLKGDGTFSRGGIVSSTYTATLLDSIGNTELPGRLLSNGGVICSGELVGTSGSAGYVGIAQITIKDSYRNKPLLFIVGNRGINPTLVSVRFLNRNDSDPGLGSIQKFGPATVKIRKTDPSTWVLYVKKSEAWDGINVLYYSNPYNNSTELSVKIMNLFMSDLPSDATEATDRWEGKVDTATTATMLDTTNANGYTTDEWGNFNHSSTNTTNYWHINKNAGDAVFSVYFESGIVDIASTGDYRKNGTSIVPTSTTTNTSGFIKFPNIKMMIAWRWVAWTGAISNAWGTGYESTAVISLGNWAASFNEEPKVVYGVRADSGQSGVTIEHYGKPSTTSAGSVYLWRPSTMTSQKYWICAIGIGKYT